MPPTAACSESVPRAFKALVLHHSRKSDRATGSPRACPIKPQSPPLGQAAPKGPMAPAMPPGVSPNTIAGPAPQGGPPAPGGAPQPPNPLPQSGPPSTASQSPPDLASLYMRLMQQQRSGQAIDHGLALMASAYAAPGTQGQIMHSMDNQQQDPSAMMNNLVQLEQMQRINSMPAPGSGGGATGGAAGGNGQPAIDPTVWNALPPDAKMKILEQRAQSSLAVSQAAQEGQAKDVEEFKNSGIQDFSMANQKLTDSQAGVDQLLKNMPATMKALADPGLLTTSKWAAWNPLGPSEEVKQQAIAIQKLEAGLTGESLSNVKNVRNKLEFNTLGEALTAGLNANNGPQGVQKALEAIKQKMAVAHAQVYATAGKQIPNQYAGLADPTFTSPTLNGKPNPYFTGATYEPAPQGGTVAGGSHLTRSAAQATSPSFRMGSPSSFQVGPTRARSATRSDPWLTIPLPSI